MKRLIARTAATLSAVALLGTALALAAPAGVAFAGATSCPLSAPVVRTTTAVTTPYGVSPNKADLITVKVLNTSATTACAEPTVTISPRAGMGFTEVVSVPAGWTCEGPGAGVNGDTVCTSTTLAKASSSTIRVRYDKIVDQTVSGSASSVLEFDVCKWRP